MMKDERWMMKDERWMMKDEKCLQILFDLGEDFCVRNGRLIAALGQHG